MDAGLEMNSLTYYNGMTLTEAKNQAVAAGFQVEVEYEGLQKLNCEYRPGRITFRVVDDCVVNARIG